MPECLICRSTAELTVEHIIPQTLLKRFGIDPDTAEGDVFKTRTTLCRSCNAGTAALHERGEMMTLIETGTPTNKRTLRQLSDWAFWVLLLLGLARGNEIVPAETARALLVERFSRRTVTSVPKGVRVYLGVASSLNSSTSPAARTFAVARLDDPSIYRSAAGKAIGIAARSGQSIQAAQSIGLGKVVLLVLGPTISSGANHAGRLDEAASTVGLGRIHPLSDVVPVFEPSEYNLDSVSHVFVRVLFGDDPSLLPEVFHKLMGSGRSQD